MKRYMKTMTMITGMLLFVVTAVSATVNAQQQAPDKELTKFESLLMLAASNGNFQQVEELVTRGININVKDERGFTPLMHASIYGDIKTIVLLVDSGANVNLKSDNNTTALMLASKFGNGSAVKYLINRDADVNVTNTSGYSAIDYARENKHTDILAYLTYVKRKSAMM